MIVQGRQQDAAPDRRTTYYPSRPV